VGLAAVLGFVGLKMLLLDLVHIPIAVSLGVIAACLAVAVGASLLLPQDRTAPRRAGEHPRARVSARH
jgi:tellurite resistance protein TerC